MRVTAATNVETYEGNTPTLTWRIRLKDVDGRSVEYPTDGYTFQFFRKDTAADPDPAAVTMTVIPDDARTLLAIVQPSGPVGTSFYRIDAVKGAERQTVAYGTWTVKDV